MIDLDNRPFKALDTLDKHKKTPLKIIVEARNIPAFPLPCLIMEKA